MYFGSTENDVPDPVDVTSPVWFVTAPEKPTDAVDEGDPEIAALPAPSRAPPAKLVDVLKVVKTPAPEPAATKPLCINILAAAVASVNDKVSIAVEAVAGAYKFEAIRA